MLVVVGVDSRVDLSTPAVGVLARVDGKCVKDSGKLDIQLDGTILVEYPVDAVLVVGGSEDVRDDKLAAASDDGGIVTEIGMLEQDTGIFLVDANGVLDDGACTCSVHKCGVHVVDGTLAIAAQGQTVGHVATAVLAQIESVLALMRVFRVTVWNHHLRQRKTVHNRTNGTLVIEGDIVQDNTFAIVEPHVNIPFLPVNHSSVHIERNTLWLSDIDWLDIRAISARLFHRLNMIVVWSGLAEWSTNFGDINVDDALGLGIVDGTEIKGVTVLRVIDVRSVVHQSLLETDIASEAFIIANCPSCFVPSAISKLSRIESQKEYEYNLRSQ